MSAAPVIMTRGQTKTAPRAIKTPRLPLTGNPSFDAKISAAQALLDEIHPLQTDGDPAKEDRLTVLLRKLRRANGAMLRGPASTLAEAETRLKAYLNAEALITMPDASWRLLPVDRALRQLEAEDEQGVSADAFRRYRSDLHAIMAAPPEPSLPLLSPSVRDAAEAFARAHAAHDAAVTAYGIVEAREVAGEISDEHPDYVAANAAVDAASDTEDAAWAAFMATPAATAEDLDLKLTRYGASDSVRCDPQVAREGFAHIRADVRRLIGRPPLADTSGPAAKAWHAARDRYFETRKMAEAIPIDDERGDASLQVVADAMERWESLAPPSIDALAEVMLASLDFNGTCRTWQKTSQAATFRDLLDGGDTHEIFAARFTLHVLRLASADHPALAAAPIAGLYPPTEAESEEDWLRAHLTAKAYPNRRPELVEWWRQVLSDEDQRQRQDMLGFANCQAAFDAGYLLTDAGGETLALVEEYEAMGGRMTLCFVQGEVHGLQTIFARNSPHADEVRRRLIDDDRKDSLRRVLEATGRVFHAPGRLDEVDEDVIATANMAAA